MTDTELIKKLRDETGAGVMEIKKALDESGGDIAKVKEALRRSGAQKAITKVDREAQAGIIETYSHNGRIGVMVEVNCETDFVARNEEFRAFVHDLALQIAALQPTNVEELLSQEYIKDISLTVEDRLHDLVGKIGEKIVIKRFVIYHLCE